MSDMSVRDFTSAGEIQELDMNEIDAVAGGPVWLVPVIIAVLATALASEAVHHHG